MGVGHSMMSYGLVKARYTQTYHIGLYNNWKYIFSKWLIQSFRAGFNQSFRAGFMSDKNTFMEAMDFPFYTINIMSVDIYQCKETWHKQPLY